MATQIEKLPESLEERYALVRDRIARAARGVGRQADEVYLVAVTKAADPEQIRRLMELGHRDFGENQVQQLVQRAAMADEYLSRLRVLPSSRGGRGAAAGESLFSSRPSVELMPPTTGTGGVRWHMIGHLQRNKAKKCVELVRLVHSVDSLRLAEELQALALKKDRVVEVLVEVNCSGESSKQGCPVAAAIPLAEQIETMVNVRVRGLMTMGPLEGGEREVRSTFARCRELFEEMRTRGFAEGRFNLLSMGMSGDFEVAIAEGANIVRVGTAIFGPAAPGSGGDEPRDADED